MSLTRTMRAMALVAAIGFAGQAVGGWNFGFTEGEGYAEGASPTNYNGAAGASGEWSAGTNDASIVTNETLVLDTGSEPLTWTPDDASTTTGKIVTIQQDVTFVAVPDGEDPPGTTGSQTGVYLQEEIDGEITTNVLYGLVSSGWQTLSAAGLSVTNHSTHTVKFVIDYSAEPDATVSFYVGETLMTIGSGSDTSAALNVAATAMAAVTLQGSGTIDNFSGSYGSSHTHSYVTNYYWAADNSTCTATNACECGVGTTTETVETTYEVTIPPTVDEYGEGTYTADFVNFPDQTKKVQLNKLPITVNISGNKGSATVGGVVPEAYYSGDEVVVTPSNGYVIAQISIDGTAVAGTLGLASFTTNLTADGLTATFAKEDAWWVAPGLFKKLNRTDGFLDGSENLSQFGFSEEKGYLGASRAPGGSSSQVVMYRLDDLNAATPDTPAYVSKSVNNGIYFDEPSVMANRSVTFVGDYLVGGNILATVDWSLGYQLPVGGVPFSWQDSDNGVVKMIASDGVGLTFMYEAPDGSVYATTYQGTKLGRYTLGGTTLTLDTAWGTAGYVTLPNGSYGVVGGVINGQTNVYVCTDSQGVFVVNAGAATPAATLLVPTTVTGRTQNMRITGTADNTPRLIVVDAGASDAIKVFDLAADGLSLVTTNPVATHAVAPLGGAAMDGYSPITGTDDDMYGYLGNSTSAGVGPYLITLRHTDYCPTTATQTVGANGSSTVKSATIYVYPDVNNSVTYTADAGYRIAALTNNSMAIPVAAGATSYELENIATDDEIVVTFELIPATIIQIVGHKGSSSVAEATITSTSALSQEYTFTPDSGYVVAAVVTNGITISGSRGQEDYTLTVEAALGETATVSAFFSKPDAWHVNPALFKTTLETTDAYNAAPLDVYDSDNLIAVAVSRSDDSARRVAFFDKDDVLNPISLTVKYNAPNHTSGVCDNIGFLHGQNIAVGGMSGATANYVWVLDRTARTGAIYTALTDDETPAVLRTVAGSSDGSKLYGYVAGNLSRYTLQANTSEGGAVTNDFTFLKDAAWGPVTNLTTPYCMRVANVNGKDIVYVSTSVGGYNISAIDTTAETPAIIKLVDTWSRSVNVVGQANSTPRLFVGMPNYVNTHRFYDLSADGLSLHTPTYFTADITTLGSRTGYSTAAMPDDEKAMFVNANQAGNNMRLETYVNEDYRQVGVQFYDETGTEYADSAYIAAHGFQFSVAAATYVPEKSGYDFSAWTNISGSVVADDYVVDQNFKAYATFTESVYNVNQALVGDVTSTVAAADTTVNEGDDFVATYTATNGWISSVYTNGAPAYDCSASPTQVVFTNENVACDINIVVATSAARPDADAWYVNPGLTADFAQVGATTDDGCAGFHWGLDATDDFLAAPLHFTGQNSTLYPVKSLEAGGSSALGTYTANTLFSANVRGASVSKPLNVHLVGSAVDAKSVLSLPLNTAAFGPNTNAFKIWTSNGTTPDAMRFTADGQYLYANAYAPSAGQNYIYKYRVLNGLKSSGTNLVLDATWTVGIRVRDMTVAHLDGKDIVYINANSALYVLDTSSTGNTPVSLGVSAGSNYAGLTVAGIGAGSPHLYVFRGDTGALAVYTIKGDYTVETTPFKSYTGAELGAICGYATVGAGGTGAAVAVTDDEATLFLGANVTDLPDRLIVIRSVPVSYPDWILNCGLEGEDLAAMQGKYDTWAAGQTVTDLMTTDYSAQFLMNADAEAVVALTITNITLSAQGNVTLAIEGTADAVTLYLADINGVLYLSTATDLAGSWTGKTFGTVPSNIGIDGIAVPVFGGANGFFFRAEVGYAAPAGSTELTAPDE